MSGGPAEDDERLRGALARLEEEHQDLRTIISVAAHDVRSPLASVHGFIQLLQTGRLDTDMAAMVLGRLSTSSADALRMIEGLFQVLRSGLSDEPAGAIQLGPVLQESAAEVVTRHPDAMVELVAEGTVWARHDDLRQLTGHLLENAASHGGPAAQVQVSVAPADDEHLVLTVADDGPGIRPEDADRIFEMYQQGPQDAPVIGKGIGLTVCRRLARALGGDVWLSTTAPPTEGAAFHVRLPVQEPCAGRTRSHGPGGTTDHI